MDARKEASKVRMRAKDAIAVPRKWRAGASACCSDWVHFDLRARSFTPPRFACPRPKPEVYQKTTDYAQGDAGRLGVHS